MGRNKLKSFGPLMCHMGMLVHIRSGSFFFKALGITLLFMAGFPDDLVQRETKYRNLDLLQKYYRYSSLLFCLSSLFLCIETVFVERHLWNMLLDCSRLCANLL